MFCGIRRMYGETVMDGAARRIILGPPGRFSYAALLNWQAMDGAPKGRIGVLFAILGQLQG